MMDPGLTILTAMITPAVLISGAGAILMSTTTRVGRVTDRIKHYTDRFRALVEGDHLDGTLATAEKEMIMGQLEIHSQRSRMLLRAMTGLYVAISLFVLASVLIGARELTQGTTGVLPTVIAVLGSLSLAYATLMLSVEVRLSAKASRQEMNFMLRLGERYSQLYDETHSPSGQAAARPVR
ncbi:hypothetical protein Deipr_0790 [Deinococcus proteolyticus MRP]|uniref:DUF2721 domain-containing protein n=1 Tax=Deinococcus proteolyticus (strain ATCC 35074 / DSM 20540 / JCM 6276 / NBRC 101906 / NCIMB 13154 / VKM Ac-1939 / CCM 2703 / MRP) TaxID=693977 RepID=F0RM26_DEIPM|nr:MULTISPECIES: DUF2721 domain-containing protein [Deinococcus]ADY25946.1 hypothetical protein Deipr_0790 [Deinococcus proteolyticus MRP]MCY1702067.1 DUF2721 domain-containing protein [Deinococcus sp. SL84]